MSNITWPFLKWAGGKRRLAHHLAMLCPKRIETYIEPFLGSGAVFLYLAQTRPGFKAVLSDSNEELVNVYICVRDRVEEVLRALAYHEKKYYRNREWYYYHIRDEFSSHDRVERAARMIFLNKTCYNGLYRVNRAGKFNVPHGSYVKPAIYNKDALLAASKILDRKEVSIIQADYADTTSGCQAGDLIYLDPPYLPITKTANFTDYTIEGFGHKEQVALAREFRRLADKGCTVILSNSNSAVITGLYEGFNIQAVEVSRSINCNADGRTAQTELVITSTQVVIRQTRRPNRL